MKKLKIRSMIGDDPATEEIFDCEHKIMNGRHMIAYDQPLYGGSARTVITVEHGRALMLRRPPYDTKLEFTADSETVGSYYTGIGVQPVKVRSGRVSVDENEDNIKIRLHYTLSGIAQNDLSVKLCMIIGGEE